MHVWLYDRDGGIQSTGINSLTDLPRFLVPLFAMQRFSFEAWRFIETYDLGAVAALKDTAPQDASLPVSVGQFSIIAKESIHRSLSLKGRGTNVVSVVHEHPPNGRSAQ